MVRAPSWYQTWTWSCPGCGQSLCGRAGRKEGPIGEYRETRRKNNGDWTIYTDKINYVSNLSGAADHDVVTVAISDAQDVGGYTVARTWQSELFDGPIKSIAVNTKIYTGHMWARSFSASLSCNTSCGPNNLKVHFTTRQHLTQSFSLWASWAKHPCWRRQLLPRCCWSAGCWQSCLLMRLPRSTLPGHLSLGNHTVRFCICREREEKSLTISVGALWTHPSWSMLWADLKHSTRQPPLIHAEHTIISPSLCSHSHLLPQFILFIFPRVKYGKYVYFQSVSLENTVYYLFTLETPCIYEL